MDNQVSYVAFEAQGTRMLRIIKWAFTIIFVQTIIIVGMGIGIFSRLVELIRIFEKTNPALPMRVDHGKTMLGDGDKGYNAGYSFHGRMLALGQVDGMMAAVRDEIENDLI